VPVGRSPWLPCVGVSRACPAWVCLVWLAFVRSRSASALRLSAPVLLGVSLAPLCNFYTVSSYPTLSVTPLPLSPWLLLQSIRFLPNLRRLLPRKGAPGPPTLSALRIPFAWGLEGHPLWFPRLVVGYVSVIHLAKVSFAAKAALTTGLMATAHDSTKPRAHWLFFPTFPFVPQSVESFGRLGASAMSLLRSLVDVLRIYAGCHALSCLHTIDQ
jgi:hypothetical protein